MTFYSCWTGVLHHLYPSSFNLDLTIKNSLFVTFITLKKKKKKALFEDFAPRKEYWVSSLNSDYNLKNPSDYLSVLVMTSTFDRMKKENHANVKN